MPVVSDMNNLSTIIYFGHCLDCFCNKIKWEKEIKCALWRLFIYKSVPEENKWKPNPSQIRFKRKQSYIVKQNKRSRKQYFSRLFGILNSRFKRHTQTAVGGFRSNLGIKLANLSKRVNNWIKLLKFSVEHFIPQQLLIWSQSPQ